MNATLLDRAPQGYTQALDWEFGPDFQRPDGTPMSELDPEIMVSLGFVRGHTRGWETTSDADTWLQAMTFEFASGEGAEQFASGSRAIMTSFGARPFSLAGSEGHLNELPDGNKRAFVVLVRGQSAYQLATNSRDEDETMALLGWMVRAQVEVLGG